MAVHEVSRGRVRDDDFLAALRAHDAQTTVRQDSQRSYRALARGLAAALPLAALGLVSVASVVVTHALFFGEDRYHMVLTPALAILGACALRRPAGEAASGLRAGATKCSRASRWYGATRTSARR